MACSAVLVDADRDGLLTEQLADKPGLCVGFQSARSIQMHLLVCATGGSHLCCHCL